MTPLGSLDRPHTGKAAQFNPAAIDAYATAWYRVYRRAQHPHPAHAAWQTLTEARTDPTDLQTPPGQ